MEPEPIEDSDIVAADKAVMQFLARRLRDPATAEELKQETLLRLLEVRHRLSREAAVPYAVTVARHLVVGRARAADIAERHLPKLVGERFAPSPEEAVLRREDEAALRAALDEVGEDDRALLLAHVVDEADTAVLAAAHGGSAGGIAARLARARAKARVDYVLASRHVVLPTEECRSVLLSLSAADQRRQRALRAADHLRRCHVCPELAPPLVERRRWVLPLVPFLALGRGFRALGKLVRAHPVSSVGTAVVAGAVAAAAVVASPTPAARQPAVLTTTRVTASSVPRPLGPIDVRALVPLTRVELRQRAGRSVVARRIPIVSVAADEGFWVGYSPDRRIWVQFATRVESPVHVVAGQRASFRGKLVIHGADFASRVGVDDTGGAQRLIDMGVHITADPRLLTITR